MLQAVAFFNDQQRQSHFSSWTQHVQQISMSILSGNPNWLTLRIQVACSSKYRSNLQLAQGSPRCFWMNQLALYLFYTLSKLVSSSSTTLAAFQQHQWLSLLWERWAASTWNQKLELVAVVAVLVGSFLGGFWWISIDDAGAGALFLLSRSFCASLHVQFQKERRLAESVNGSNLWWLKWFLQWPTTNKLVAETKLCLLNVVDHNFQQCAHRSNCGLVCTPICCQRQELHLP